MRYMLLICGYEPDILTSSEDEEMPDCTAWVEEMTRRGVLLASEGLRMSSDATTVRVREGEVLLSDGPFAETKEQVAGFSLIECSDLDVAIEVASRHPAASAGMIEVRPVWEK